MYNHHFIKYLINFRINPKLDFYFTVTKINLNFYLYYCSHFHEKNAIYIDPVSINVVY